MKRIDAEKLRELIAFGNEQRSVEFKSAGHRSDRNFSGKVLRAMIAMAHRPDGGHIIIGVEEIDNTPEPIGVSEEVAQSWVSHDEWADKVRTYVDPPIEFSLYKIMDDSKFFLVLSVESFLEVPIVCVKEWRGDDQSRQILRDGAIYVRSLDKIESREARPAELRELLNLSFEKRLTSYMRLRSIENSVVDGQEFGQEKARLMSAMAARFSPLWEEVTKRGFFVISIALFSKEKPIAFEYQSLIERVHQSQVEGGWNFPHISDEDVVRENDMILNAIDFGPYRQTWAISEKGMFVFFSAFKADWPEKAIHGAPRAFDVKGRFLNVYEMIRKYLEAFAFSSRLAKSSACDRLDICFEMNDLIERPLYLSSSRPFFGQKFSIEEYKKSKSYSVDDVNEGDNEEAFLLLQEFFARAGWNVEVSTLRDIASELR